MPRLVSVCVRASKPETEIAASGDHAQ